MNFPPPSKTEILSSLFQAAHARFVDNYFCVSSLPAEFVKTTFAYCLSLPLPALIAIHPNLITIRYPDGMVVERKYVEGGDNSRSEFVLRAAYVDAHGTYATWRPDQLKDKYGPYANWPSQKTYTLPVDLEKLQKKIADR